MSERMILGRKVEKVQFSSPGGVLKGKVEVQEEVFWDFTIEPESPQRPGNLPKISSYLYSLMRNGSSTPRLSCIGGFIDSAKNPTLKV